MGAWWLVSLGLTQAASWPTAGQDTRRSGQIGVVGPEVETLYRERDYIRELVSNAPPAIDADGRVLLGSWGVIQGHPDADRRTWNKFDGALILTDLDIFVRTQIDGEEVPYCYDYQDRTDRTACPDGGHVRYGNGIFDGTPTLTGDGEAWAGRGDGLLYRVDLDDPGVVWTFATFNPLDAGRGLVL